MKSIVSKLLPEQIAAFWDVIKFAVEQSLPPLVYDHPDKMNRILSAALRGTIEVWAEYTKDEDKPPRFEGIALTQELYDEPSGTKNMLIYCLYGYNPIDPGSWARTLSVMTKYAKEKGYSQMIAYSSVPHVVNLARGLGANTDYTFISFDVDEIVEKLNDLGG
jgi:hypothetical protein